jgi:hypothetical protein
VPELKYLLTTTLCAQAGALKSKVKIIVAKQKRTRLITLLKNSQSLTRETAHALHERSTQQSRRAPEEQRPDTQLEPHAQPFELAVEVACFNESESIGSALGCPSLKPNQVRRFIPKNPPKDKRTRAVSATDK